MIDNRANIAGDLKACKTAFEAAGVPWVIIGGIVLGYARYKDIMPWDTDVDVAVFTEISDEQWLKLLVNLHRDGLRFPKHKVDFMYCHRNGECNLEFFHRDGDVYSCYPASTPGIKFVENPRWFDDIQHVDFLNGEYPIPNHVEEFVAAHYGGDWRTNIIKDHEIYFADKRGGRNQSTWTTSRASKYGDLWPKALKIGDSMEI